jgi:hypothetical protein
LQDTQTVSAAAAATRVMAVLTDENFETSPWHVQIAKLLQRIGF